MDSENYKEGQSMQRPPLFEANCFIYWENCFETYVKSKDIDLCHIIVYGNYKPTIQKEDLSTLALDELIGNLKVYEVILEKDSEISKSKKEKYKSLALKARKVLSEEEASSSDNEDEEYVMAIKEDKKEKEDRSDSEDDSKKEEICLMALDNNEVLSDTPYYSSSSLDNESWQNEYDKLCKISLRIINKNKQLKAKNEVLKKEACELKTKVEQLERNKEIILECESCVNLQTKISSLTLKLASFKSSSSSLQEMLEMQKTPKDKHGMGYAEDIDSTSNVKIKRLSPKDEKMPIVELASPVPSAREPASSVEHNRLSAESIETLEPNIIKEDKKEKEDRSDNEDDSKKEKSVLWHLTTMSLRIINKNKQLKAKNEVLKKEACELKTKVEQLERNKEISLECESCVNLQTKISSLTLKLASFKSSSSSLQKMLEMQKPPKDKQRMGYTEDIASTSNVKIKKLSPKDDKMPTVEPASPVPSTREPASSVEHNLLSAESTKTLEPNIVRLKVNLEPDEQIKDSGCSRHMTGNKDLFSSYKSIDGVASFLQIQSWFSSAKGTGRTSNNVQVFQIRILKFLPLPIPTKFSLSDLSNPRPSSPSYQALSPPTDYQMAPPSSPNVSPPLSPIATPEISPSKLLLTPKSSPPPLTSPQLTPTQPSKHSLPLTINLDPVELIFLTSPTSPHTFFDSLEDLPPRTTNHHPP
ncbi:hypothetical protein Tco_1393154 [Tanacetum coccineum]